MPNLVTAQTPPQDDTATQERSERGDRDRSDRRSRREERRRRWEQYNTATAAERAQMRVDRLVDMTSRIYDLDDSQQVMVRNEILQMQAERRVAMGADADEYDKLREKMVEIWQTQRDEGSADEDRRSRRERRRAMRANPEYSELRERMRAIEDKYPMDWEAAAKRVEALLPPEQAERGRARRAEREARWRDRGRDRDRRRGQVRDNDRGVVAGDSVDNVQNPMGSAPVQQPMLQKGAAKAVHPWETYTNEFIARHELTPTQVNSAQAILRDLMQRAAQIETSLADRIADAEKVTDNVSRRKRLAEIRAPIDSLFDELKGRLDGLLTAAQRQAAR